MLSIQVIRERTDEVRESLRRRRADAPVDEILALDERRRSLLTDVEAMRRDRNEAGKRIGAARDDAERQRLIEEQRAVAGRLDAMEDELRKRAGDRPGASPQRRATASTHGERCQPDVGHDKEKSGLGEAPEQRDGVQSHAGNFPSSASAWMRRSNSSMNAALSVTPLSK